MPPHVRLEGPQRAAHQLDRPVGVAAGATAVHQAGLAGSQAPKNPPTSSAVGCPAGPPAIITTSPAGVHRGMSPPWNALGPHEEPLKKP
jgi:hypothetical protein